MSTWLHWLPVIVLIVLVLVLVIEFACIRDRRDAYTRARTKALADAVDSMMSQAEIAYRAATNPEYSSTEQRQQVERCKTFTRAALLIGTIPKDRL